jgi:hypothetical protein
MPSMNGTQNSAKTVRNRDGETRAKRSRSAGQRVLPEIPAAGHAKSPSPNLHSAFADLQVDELPLRIRKRLKDGEGLSLAANGVLGLYLSMGEGSHSAAKELREGIEGKLTAKIDLTVDVNRDVVERLQEARNACRHRGRR